jgi:LysM repeat protein
MMMHISDPQSDAFNRPISALRTIMLCGLAVAALATSACGELEPIVEPEIVDLQLTLDTLRTQVRETQRSLVEVRADLESRRQELADAQVARAQLEGRVREAERRVAEARHVIEVQREELLAARAERERVFRSSSHLNSQTRQLQRNVAKQGMAPIPEPADTLVPTGASYQWSLGSVTPAVNALPAKRAATASMSQNSPIREIVVMPGDTLWSLAHSYRIGLNRLRSINHLTDNQIEVGQILFLSENRVLTGSSVETNR